MSPSPSITDWIQAGGTLATLVVTVILVYLTFKSVTAAARMTQLAARDFKERNRAWLDLAVKVEFSAEWTYTLDIDIENKGLTPIRVDRLVVTAGPETLFETPTLILGPGQVRRATVRINLHDLAVLHLKEGQKVPVQVRAEYRESDLTPQVLVHEPVLHHQKTPGSRQAGELI